MLFSSVRIWLTLSLVFTAVTLIACVSPPAPPTESASTPPPTTTEHIAERPANATNYLRDLVYPHETDNFAAVDVVQLDDPLDGIVIYYEDTRDYPDVITVVVHPIHATSWRDQNLILNDELDSFQEELDNTVASGFYQYHRGNTRSDFKIAVADGEYAGKKYHFEFANKQGVVFNCDAYFFIQKDKIIKFRTSSPQYFTPDWTGDLIVQELLPHFSVPDESEFMRSLRDQFRQKN